MTCSKVAFYGMLCERNHYQQLSLQRLGLPDAECIRFVLFCLQKTRSDIGLRQLNKHLLAHVTTEINFFWCKLSLSMYTRHIEMVYSLVLYVCFELRLSIFKFTGQSSYT